MQHFRLSYPNSYRVFHRIVETQAESRVIDWRQKQHWIKPRRCLVRLSQTKPNSHRPIEDEIRIASCWYSTLQIDRRVHYMHLISSNFRWVSLSEKTELVEIFTSNTHSLYCQSFGRHSLLKTRSNEKTEWYVKTLT